MKWVKKNYRNILLSLTFLIGLAVFTYPLYQNSLSQIYDQYLIRQFQKESAKKNVTELADLKAEYEKQNAEMREQNVIPADEIVALGDVEVEEQPVDFFEEHTLAILTIPSIKGEMPVFDTGTDAFLNNGAALLNGSSLPVGGEGTHAVIMAHRGMPEAELFSKLPDMVEGDLFFIEIAGEKLAYEVDQIKIIEPTEIEDLLVVDGKDYVTLLTCTPYMVNSHRLIVRGERIDYLEEHDVLQAGIGNYKWLIIAATFLGIIIAVTVGIWWINRRRVR